MPIFCSCISCSLNYDNLKELLDNFLKMAQENKEHLTKQQFADHLGVPVTDQLTEMFELYDRVRYLSFLVH